MRGHVTNLRRLGGPAVLSLLADASSGLGEDARSKEREDGSPVDQQPHRRPPQGFERVWLGSDCLPSHERPCAGADEPCSSRMQGPVTTGVAVRSWLLHSRSTPMARVGSPQPKGPSHAAHDRSRPRRVRRVGELGRRHRPAAGRGPSCHRRRQPAARARLRRRRRQRPRPHDRRARSCSSRTPTAAP